MPITIKQNLMKYKSQSQHQYIGINCVAERATADQIEDIEAAGADTIAEVNAAIAAGQTAIDGIETQKNQMIASIAQVAGQGTDATFTQQGVAADAKAVGDLKSALNTLEDYVTPENSKIVLRSFPSDTTLTNAANNFVGFATRYSYTGIITGVEVRNLLRGTAPLTMEVALYNADFTKKIASQLVTKESSYNHLRNSTVIFDNLVKLEGDFYIAIHATSTDTYVNVANETSTVTTATETYQNKYIAATNPTEWRDIGTTGYCIDFKLLAPNDTNVRQKNIVYVGSDDTCDYATLQDAMDSITDDADNNRYTIYVKPGTYARFSQENAIRYLSIIGLDRDNCIVYDETGNYETPPFECRMDGCVENLSFVMKATDETYSPSQNHEYAYALHIDYSGPYHVTFRNCYFESNSGPAVGLGSHENTTIEFNNCEFLRIRKFGSELGAVFAHTITGDVAGQNFIFRDCTALNKYNATGAKGFYVSKVSGTVAENVSFVFQRCGAFNNGGANATVPSDLVSMLSWGNNVDAMNYSAT